ncbi:MAG: hypothetical protein AABW56_05465 [Nanoarchaeota archaeon]
MSNVWPYLNYFNVTAESSPRKELVKYYINNGYRILLFYNEGEPSYILDKKFLKSLRTIKETNEFILLGDKGKCYPREDEYVYNYLYNLNQTTNILYNYSIGTSAKEVIFNDY